MSQEKMQLESQLQSQLKSRNLPPLFGKCGNDLDDAQANWTKRRQEMEEILSHNFCGYPPGFSHQVESKIMLTDENGYGGKAVVYTVTITVKTAYASEQFPVRVAIPKGVEQPPFFVYLSFTQEIADGIGEEILDQGYGMANVYYQDIAPDYYDQHQNGLGRLCTRNCYDSWGKLRIWAFGASAMLDVLLEHGWGDPARMAVMGHSRLGKTSLLAGAFDQRFSLAVVNEAGAGGTALFRGKTGETIENLYGKGSRLWFAGNFFRYLDQIDQLPFDQHFLVALMAPRHLYVASAKEDTWADPASEFLGCIAAADAYHIHGKQGLVSPDRLPEAGDVFHQGNIGYHMRPGTHYLSRYDWQKVMEYRQKHQV